MKYKEIKAAIILRMFPDKISGKKLCYCLQQH